MVREMMEFQKFYDFKRMGRIFSVKNSIGRKAEGETYIDR